MGAKPRSHGVLQFLWAGSKYVIFDEAPRRKQVDHQAMVIAAFSHNARGLSHASIGDVRETRILSLCPRGHVESTINRSFSKTFWRQLLRRGFRFSEI